VCYPGVVRDPDTGAWISDARGRRNPLHRFRIHPGPDHRPAGRAPSHGRPLPRRAGRYHPFVADTDLSTAEADINHRQHAIIETVLADLVDGPLAYMPSDRFGANSAWMLCAAIAHNLMRAAGVLAGDHHSRARGSTLRRQVQIDCHGPNTSGTPRQTIPQTVPENMPSAIDRAS
jgi:hypothetical protein